MHSQVQTEQSPGSPRFLLQNQPLSDFSWARRSRSSLPRAAVSVSGLTSGQVFANYKRKFEERAKPITVRQVFVCFIEVGSRTLATPTGTLSGIDGQRGIVPPNIR
jgi:hypothetical protein